MNNPDAYAHFTNFKVIDKPADDPEWWLARNSMGDTGLIPCNYVQVVNMPASLKTQQQSTTNGGAPTASNAGAGANGGGTGTRTSTSGAHSTTSASSLSPNVSTAGSAAPQLKPRGSYVRGGPFASIAWFWGTITRSEAEHMLISRAVIGEFVVRECESTVRSIRSDPIRCKTILFRFCSVLESVLCAVLLTVQ